MTNDIKRRGNYDDECERQLVESGAEFVILFVLNGNKGSGFSVSGIDGHKDSKLPKFPFILRDIADTIEADIKQRART